MERVRLDDLLRQIDPDAPAVSPQAIAQIDGVRASELSIRRFLPDFVIRRLSRAFSRSNTVHPETALALYAIARVLDAREIVETGTYWGYSTTYLAAAVRDNGGGMVRTFDLYAHAGKHIPSAFAPYVEKHLGKPSTETLPEALRGRMPDLFFQDSRHDYTGVFEELEIVAPLLRPDGVILFHDFIAPEVVRAAQEALPGWRLLAIDNTDPQILGIALPPRRPGAA